MNKNKKRLFFICILFLMAISISAKSQSFVGAGFGTAKVSGEPFRVFGPTFKYEHFADNRSQSYYFDLTYFSKSENGNYSNPNDYTKKNSYIYAQLGFKALLSGDADEKKVIPYIGGGIALSMINQKNIINNNSAAAVKSSESLFNYGFHFSAGIQYYLKPAILELRGNLDINLKGLAANFSDASNALTNTRVCVLIPISK
jgi:opacity protein-like surface antigen